MHADSSNATLQYPLSALLPCYLFTDFNAVDSFLVMFDVKGFDFYNLRQTLHQNSRPKASRILETADLAVFTMGKLDTPFSIEKLSPLLSTDSFDAVQHALIN